MCELLQAIIIQALYSKVCTGPNLVGSLPEGTPFFIVTNIYMQFFFFFMPSSNLSKSSIANLQSSQQVDNPISHLKAKLTTHSHTTFEVAAGGALSRHGPSLWEPRQHS